MPRSRWFSSEALLVVALAVVLIAAAVVGACTPAGGCFCAPCANAISVFVVDEAGAPISDGWELEATLDGAIVDTLNCSPDLRTANQCAFGFETGVYDIVVRTPEFEKHVTARSAARGGINCCIVCVATEPVPIVLSAR
jgi:hypothetical protein